VGEKGTIQTAATWLKKRFFEKEQANTIKLTHWQAHSK